MQSIDYIHDANQAMNATTTACRAIAALLAIAGLAQGCACCHPHHGGLGHGHGGYWGFSPPICFGYASTCWSAWPEECVACPTFAFPPQTVEPLPAKTLPAIQPEPPVESAPLPEPSPSDERPAPENQQSRHEPKPPVLTIDPIAKESPVRRELLIASEPSPAIHIESRPPAAPTPVVVDVSHVEPAPSSVTPPPAVNNTPAGGAAAPAAAAKKTRLTLSSLFNGKTTTSPASTKAASSPSVSQPPAVPSEFGPPPVLMESPIAVHAPGEPIRVMHYEAAPANGDAPQMIFNTTADFQHQPPPAVLIESPPVEPSASPYAAPILSPAELGPRTSHIIADWGGAEPVLAPIASTPQQNFPAPAPFAAASQGELRLAPIVSPEAARRGVAPVRSGE